MIVMQGGQTLCPFTHGSSNKIESKLGFLRTCLLAWTLLILEVDLGNGLRTALRRRFRHVVDNIGDSLGLVADWVTVSCGWRTYSPVARGRGGDSDHQSGDWSTSCLKVSCDERR